MNSIVLLIVNCTAVFLGLLHVFFGYKLARFLLPLCGMLFALSALFVFVYDMLSLNAVGTYMFFIGSGLAVYIILFLIPRIAAFFTGLAGSALFMVFAVYALNLHGAVMFYPAAMTVCVLSGLLAAAYKRVGVVTAAAVFGGCISSFAGVYLYIERAGVTDFQASGSILVSLEYFLAENATLIGGAALLIVLLGVAVQFARTADKQLLEGGIKTVKRGSLKETNDLIINL